MSRIHPKMRKGPRLTRSEAANGAWEKRRALYGPTGHKPKPKWRRAPSSRAIRVADQSVVTHVPRETST